MAVAWSLLFWLLMFVMNLAFIVSSFYQLLCLVDLEGDQMNPFEASASINFWVVKEFLLYGVFSVLLLVTGHWLIFLITLPLAGYHALLYMKRQHLIDVTEVFRNLKVEKNLRLFKLGFYVVFFVIVVFNLAIATFEAVSGMDDDLHTF
ncbi:protein cornichon homolog 1-like isoform X1 [Mangifera indica]|uniref:protein cornichon homolog 1-like isoform X1 n=1 Tax=Mangifera indica TaxID=29780 RepID=UPI001CFB5B40|nr:protein cornichon homolog 1-like isoform X1 [Mangifera indica]XP_044504676.1 protein cornichon homolog 1-like isoform X1 [Mangifera indica]